jgi:hypothetical protein
MTELEAAIAQVTERLGLAQRLRELAARERFAEVAGAALARHVRAERVHRGTLYLVADSGPWAHQVHLLRRSLLERLARAVGGEAVREIRVRVGDVPAEPGAPDPPARADPAPAVDPARLRALVEAIGQPELRQAVWQAVLAAARRGRVRPESAQAEVVPCSSTSGESEPSP